MTYDLQLVMIFFDNVSKIYNNSAALKDVTLTIHPKEFVSIVGASGSGKTTLLKLLLREEDPTEGKIFLDSVEITALKKDQMHHIRRRIGVIFQDYKLLSAKTAYENIAFAMEAAGKSEEEVAEDVPQVLDIVGLADKKDNFPHQLSGGERQRVAIARALVNRPDVVLADEPTGNLDPIHTRDVIKLLEKINRLGTTVVLASHDKEVINSIEKRVVTIDKGKIISDHQKGKYLA